MIPPKIELNRWVLIGLVVLSGVLGGDAVSAVLRAVLALSGSFAPAM